MVTDPAPETPKHRRRGRTILIGGSYPESVKGGPDWTPTTRKALDRMEAHRKFHAAESGQLQPRLRTESNSTSKHKHSSSETTSSEPEPIRAVSWPITNGEVLVDFNAPQKTQTKISPQVVPFRAFIEMHPPPPQSLAKMPPSAWTGRTQELLNGKLDASKNRKRITIKSSEANQSSSDKWTTSPLLSTDETDINGSVSSRGTRTRNINDGFEVLPAGTLNASFNVKDFGYSRKPLSETSNETRKSRKLQKRSRSSSSERRSSIDTIRRISSSFT